MRTISITSLLVLAAVCGACGGSRPPVTPEPASAQVMDWPAPAQPLWPASTRRVQVIVSSPPGEAHSLVWVVSEGTQVVAVYRVAAAGYTEAQARIASAHPLFTVVLHPGTEPRTLTAPVPGGGGGGSTGSSSGTFQCPGGPCIYVPWTPPATGPIIPPNVLRLVLRLGGALDALHEAWAGAAAGAAQ
jgi:hypothetical protein